MFEKDISPFEGVKISNLIGGNPKVSQLMAKTHFLGFWRGFSIEMVGAYSYLSCEKLY